MILYHGSIKEIPSPAINIGRDKLDFGRGFYVTELFEQAKIWACKRASILNGNPVISTYEITNTNGLNIHRFDGPSEEWLDFIVANRKGIIKPHNYDIIIGEMADDQVYDSINLYIREYIPKEELLRRIKMQKRNQQVCIVNQEAIQRLRFIKGECV